MEPVKRVEIIIDHVAQRHLSEVLEQNGFNSYTLLPDTSGKGDRGSRVGDGFSGEFNNSYFLVACPEATVQKLVDLVRPMLKQFGGVCLVTDALWVKH